MKNLIYNIPILLLICCFLMACECEEPHQELLEVPDPFLAEIDIEQNGQGTFVYLRFNKAVEPKSIVFNDPTNSSVIVEGTTFLSLVQQNPFTYLIIAEYGKCGVVDDVFVCEATVRLKSSEDFLNAVRSSENQLLDGDFNGRDGGDFEQAIAVPF